MEMAVGNNLHDSLSKNGYVIIPSFLDPESVQHLRKTARSTIKFAQDGKWPHLRTMPRQFPPWSSDPSAGIWGIQHLLHPDLPDSDVYASSYFNDTVIDAVKQIIQCPEDELVMELYNMLVGTEKDFELRWHRDDIPATASVKEEEARLCGDHDESRSYSHAQWNIPLYEDSCLVVVPGSHRRARTESERAADPYQSVLDGMKVVELKAGDAVFYDHNILHRGVYPGGKPRATLHGSIGKTGTDRARVILQHGVGDWIRRRSFSGLGDLSGRAESMKRRLVDVDDAREGKDIGFSLDH